jgi:hypothetical protein
MTVVESAPVTTGYLHSHLRTEERARQPPLTTTWRTAVGQATNGG